MGRARIDPVKRPGFCAALLVACVFTASPGDAMSLAQYDRLSSDDQSRYIILLMNRTIAYLYAQGRNENAVKLTSFFNGDEDVAQIAIDDGLETARWREKETGRPHDVEHAVSLALDSVDIQVSRDVLVTLVPDFKPAARNAASPRN
jgi:hypothetical protein